MARAGDRIGDSVTGIATDDVRRGDAVVCSSLGTSTVDLEGLRETDTPLDTERLAFDGVFWWSRPRELA